MPVTSTKLPVVFSVGEIKDLFAYAAGTKGLMLKLIYGGGLRVSECCRLRLMDLDFDQQLIFVRNGKGGKDRNTLTFRPPNHGSGFSHLQSFLKPLKQVRFENMRKPVSSPLDMLE